MKRFDRRLEAGLQTGKNGDATIIAEQAVRQLAANLLEDDLRLALEGAYLAFVEE